MTYRHLLDLPSIGPRALGDLTAIGIQTVEQLALADPDDLFVRLEKQTGLRQDPCVLDSFRCAAYAAHTPTPDPARLQWWWWSWARKSGHVRPVPGR